MTKVTIADYGAGNMLNVLRAFKHCEGEIELAEDAETIARAARLVVPGVGAFGDCMASVCARGLEEPILRFAETGRPLLGICVGMQILFDGSEEFGSHRGLGLVPGRVTAIPSAGTDGVPHKIPRIGWNELVPTLEGGGWEETILDGLDPGSSVYFVHSFGAHPEDPGHRLATSDYDGRAVTAAVRRGSVYGCQFHPEKSGPVGLKIIRNFLALS